jgi:hypothetical protein
VIIVMIVLVPGLFRNLPQPALATVMITASLSLAGADPPKWILIAAEPITDVDTTASDVLEELTRTIDPDHFYPTIESAVAAYRRETGAEWCKAP